MAIDTNDIKILIHSSLEILMKSCWQCLKDHPIISVVLLVFLSLYIFIPSLFYLLFYTSPFVICTIILVQGHSQSSHQNIRTDKPESQSSHGGSGASSRRPRPSIQAAMSRRTFKKRTCEELGTILMEDLKVDFVVRSFSYDIPMKPRDQKVSVDSKRNGEAQKDDKFKPKLPVVDCCNEEDQMKDMDLGLSELERNKRLESLIAKRRARKMFNMNVHRINPLNPVANDLIPPINTERNNTENEGGQPGSAPSVLGPTNPFDLPYDPSEEKPVLTGDGFAEEILITQPKDMHYCRHESFTYGPSFFTDYFDHLHSKSRVSLFTNPMASMAPGLPKSRRYSDAGGGLWHVPEKPSRESENVNQIHQVQPKKMQSNHHEEDVSPNCEYTDTILLESRDATKEQEPVDTSATEINQGLIDDDNDDTSSLSSLETSTDFAKASDDVTIAVKNENFRNSVKKVLAVIQKNRASAYDNEDISPSPAHRTKMEERALYTRPSHHPSYSLASDMQVEFSDEPNSPTDVESLVFDSDADEDSQGSVELEEQGTRSITQLECSQESLNNFDDFNVESSQAEGDTVQTSNILPVYDHQHEEYNHKNVAMVGSASTSTEQNIDTYIHLPSSNSNDPTIQNQNHNSHDPISSSSPTSVLQETITMADNQGSIHAGSRASPRSVLPETIPVRELAPSWQDHQPQTPDEEASTFLNEEESKEMVHEPTNL